ncbi:MAG: glycosyltransferase, partial [Pseudomonadota bacterium]
AKSRAVVFTPVDEDYGYVTPEAMLASKAVITLEDSGGATEFVQHDSNGLVVKPDARELALALDRFWSDRVLAEKMGSAARERVNTIDLSWDKVIASLL